MRANPLSKTLDVADHADLARTGDGVEILKGLYRHVEMLAAQGSEPLVYQEHVNAQSGLAHAGETEREGESVHGQKCSVILVKPSTPITGLAGVRLWADRKTGCLMQAEQLDEKMKPLRRLWGTRVKKFDGERWMVSVLEVETLGSRHRTKITVDSIRELER